MVVLVRGVVLSPKLKTIYESSTDWIANDVSHLFLVAAIDETIIVHPLANTSFTNIPTGLCIPISSDVYAHIRPIQVVKGLFDGEFSLIDRSNKDIFVFPTPIVDENRNFEINICLKNIGKNAIEIQPNRVLAVFELILPVKTTTWKFKHADVNSSQENFPTWPTQTFGFGRPPQNDVLPPRTCGAGQQTFSFREPPKIDFLGRPPQTFGMLPEALGFGMQPQTRFSIRPAQTFSFGNPLQNNLSARPPQHVFGFGRSTQNDSSIRPPSVSFGQQAFGFGKTPQYDLSAHSSSVSFGPPPQTFNFRTPTQNDLSVRPSSVSFGQQAFNFEKPQLYNIPVRPPSVSFGQQTFDSGTQGNLFARPVFGTPGNEFNKSFGTRQLNVPQQNVQQPFKNFSFGTIVDKSAQSFGKPEQNRSLGTNCFGINQSSKGGDVTFVLNRVTDPGDIVNVTILPNAAAIPHFTNADLSLKILKDSYCIELFSNVQASIDPLKAIVIPTGIRVEFPSKQLMLQIWNLESAKEMNLSVLDEGQMMTNESGEIIVYLINHGTLRVCISRGDKIARLVALEIPMDVEVE